MKPSAYITETEQGDMVWRVNDYAEACTYCDDGHPEPLYKSQAHVMQQAFEALNLPCNRWNKQQTLIVNAAITALRDALNARETK
jgi:glutathione peroxidase-family protein